MTSEPDMTPDVPPRRRIWPKVLLAASLSLNLLIIGMVAGATWKYGGRDTTRTSRDGGALSLIMALPRADRVALRGEMNAALEGQVPAQGNRADMAELLQQLRATPFDNAAVAEIFDSHHAGFALRHKIGQQVLLAHIAAMSDAERADYADRITAGMARRDRRRER